MQKFIHQFFPIYLFFIICLAACTQVEPSPTLPPVGATPTADLVVTAVPLEITTPEPTPITPVLSVVETAVPSPTAIAETPFSPDPHPSQTPRPRPTKYVIPPTPTSPPPLDVAALLEQLAFERVDGVNGRSLSQLPVTPYGLRGPHYCQYGPYRWLDNDHLLLFPVTGYTNWFENPTGGEVTQPIVVSLADAAPWLSDISPTDRCDLPIWSSSLQRLIAASDGQVRLRDLQGGVTDAYNGQMPLFLAPSGRRLLAGLTWFDLDTGEHIDLESSDRVKFPQPAWATDEQHFFECCFGYGDIHAGTYHRQSYPGVRAGGIGVGPGFTGDQAHWVANDTQILVEPHAVYFRRDDDKRSVVPLVDPAKQTYEEVTTRLGLPDSLFDCFPGVAPNGNHFWLGCSILKDDFYMVPYPTSYLIELPSWETIPITGSLEFRGWSGDSRFLAYTDLTDADLTNSETYSGTTWLLDTVGNRQQIADEAAHLAHWHDVEPLVALRFAAQQRMQFVQAEYGNSRVVTLDAPIRNVIWQPERGGVALLAENGRIWWLSDPFDPTVEPELLIPSLPDIHSPRWSPDGNRLTFVSETTLFIVSLFAN